MSDRLTSSFSNILQQNYEHSNQRKRSPAIPMLFLHSMASIWLAADAFPKLHHGHSIRHNVANREVLVVEILDTHFCFIQWQRGKKERAKLSVGVILNLVMIWWSLCVSDFYLLAQMRFRSWSCIS